MRKKKTTDEFVDEARKVHGDRYGYGKVVYAGNKKKVIITCPEHGDFEQIPNSHLRGWGCRKCKYEKLSDSRRSDSETFIKRAVEVHGDRYGYGKVVYAGNKKEVTITCPVHGDFEQRPNNHLIGWGCRKCQYDDQRSDTETFIKRAVEVHGGRYGYGKVVYTGSNRKVKITCPEHGYFEQTPSNHLSGRGCPKCTNTWSGDGVVYVMCSPEGHNKIGIAKSGTEYNRLNQILRSQQQKAPTAITDLSLACAYSFNDGSFTEARRFEGKSHRRFRKRRKQFSDKFDGSKEFFTVPVSEICSYLESQGGKLVTITKQNNLE